MVDVGFVVSLGYGDSPVAVVVSTIIRPHRTHSEHFVDCRATAALRAARLPQSAAVALKSHLQTTFIVMFTFPEVRSGPVKNACDTRTRVEKTNKADQVAAKKRPTRASNGLHS